MEFSGISFESAKIREFFGILLKFREFF